MNEDFGFDVVHVEGSKGGSSKPKPPTESPDSLLSVSFARIIDLLSEGEIYGLVNGEQSVFLDETPLRNSDASPNFSGFKIDYRWGTQTQNYMPGFPSVENEIGVGVDVPYSTPWVRAVTNSQLSAVKIRMSISNLYKQNTTTGDVSGYSVPYAIDLSVNGGAYATVVNSAFTGKTTSKYERTHRLELPAGSSWQVRVRKLQADSQTSSIADTIRVEAITEVIDAKFRYPNSAIVGIQFDASQFSSIPRRAYHVKGRIVKVPTNYQPDQRLYTGVWDGTFKLAYTNNPAWIFYDLLLNDRYGLGHRLNAQQVDKWELYRIGQYCDVMVPDGKGGVEPRFTCNVYLQSRADALRVIQDMASCFRGMTYYGSGQVISVCDMPEDPVYTYTQANVIGGKFSYTGSSKRTRYSVALISWSDMTDFGRQKVVYVEDREALLRYGYQPLEMTAFACTSESQAQRVGKWALLTNKMETDSVGFSVGLDATLVRPGKIIKVADNDRAGKRIGGRLRSATTTQLVLDSSVTAYAGDRITVIMPDGTAQTRVITGVGQFVTMDNTSITFDNGTLTMDTEGLPGTIQSITVNPALPAVPPKFSIWALESDTLATQTFRVMSVKEDFTGEKMQYNVTAIKHVAGKYGFVDNGAKIDSPPITTLLPSAQTPPTNVVVTSYQNVVQGISFTNMRVTWNAVPGAIAYEMQWRRNNSDWVIAGRTGTAAMEVPNIYAGTYLVRVRAINSMEISSVWTTGVETELLGKTTPPPVVVNFTASPIVFGIVLKWGFPVGSDDVLKTTINYGPTDVFANSTLLGDFPYPNTTHTLQGLAAGQTFYFWARLTDKSGNVGTWTGPITGTSSTSAAEILNYLTGKILETQLGQDLLERINLIDGPDTMPGSVSAKIKSEADIRLTQDSALSTRIDTVTATANNAAAAVQTEATARANADGALATNITNVQAVANSKNKTFYQTDAPSSGMATGDLWYDTNDKNKMYRYNGSSWVLADNTDIAYSTAAVQTNATAIANTNGQLAAMYTIKTQVTSGGRTYMAGIGIGVDNASGILESQVLITADRFAVINVTNGVVSSPFIIQGGVVYINSAFIQTASITNAMIADAAITYAKIGVGQVGTIHIGDATITNAKIGDLQVNTLKIAGRSVTIPSSVYTEGTVTCPGALNVQNWTAVQGLGVTGTGWEAMMTFTAMVSMNTAAGYWRVRRNDGAILASGQIGYNSNTFNTPCVSLCVSIMTAAAGYREYWLDIAPWSNNLTFQTIYVANRGITYLEVMR